VTRSFQRRNAGFAVDAPSTMSTENDMTTFRKLGCLMGLALGLCAGGVQAQSYSDPSYDRYDDRDYDRGYESDDPYYDRDRRQDERWDGRYRRTVVCESRDRRTTYCHADVRGGVRLVRQLSDRRCVRGGNWGTSERGIWVTDGCRAEFEVAGQYRYGETVRCESTDNRTRYCNADTRHGVRLWRQLSRTRCEQGRNWGVTRNSIWVTRGCRADFRVGDRGGTYYRD
jgi:hypothetical protein